ncbi:MAG: hypothetical protein ACRDLB_16900, partial [Actinomycetota bacterium]
MQRLHHFGLAGNTPIEHQLFALGARQRADLNGGAKHETEIAVLAQCDDSDLRESLDKLFQKTTDAGVVLHDV